MILPYKFTSVLLHIVVRLLHRVDKKYSPKYRYVFDICRYFTFTQIFKSLFDF